MKKILLLVIITFLYIQGSAIADEEVVYIDGLKKIIIPSSLYSIEKDKDYFYNWESPLNKMNVTPFDLDEDGTSELFVSNPYNNSLFFKFWRVYKSTNKGYKLIAEMPCSSIRVCSGKSDGYKDIECYNYVTVVEGLLSRFRFFSDQYYSNCTNKIESRHFYTEQYPIQQK